MSHLENYQQMMQVRSHNNTFLNIIAQDWQNLYKNYCDAILLFGIFSGTNTVGQMCFNRYNLPNRQKT